MTSTRQLGEMVKWDATNKTGEPQLAACVVLVLNGSTQLGELGPLQLTVGAGATAEQYSEVTTLAESTRGNTAQIVCQKGYSPTDGCIFAQRSWRTAWEVDALTAITTLRVLPSPRESAYGSEQRRTAGSLSLPMF